MRRWLAARLRQVADWLDYGDCGCQSVDKVKLCPRHAARLIVEQTDTLVTDKIAITRDPNASFEKMVEDCWE